jgi:hypothetical protein
MERVKLVPGLYTHKSGSHRIVIERVPVGTETLIFRYYKMDIPSVGGVITKEKLGAEYNLLVAPNKEEAFYTSIERKVTELERERQRADDQRRNSNNRE